MDRELLCKSFISFIARPILLRLPLTFDLATSASDFWPRAIEKFLVQAFTAHVFPPENCMKVRGKESISSAKKEEKKRRPGSNQ